MFTEDQSAVPDSRTCWRKRRFVWVDLLDASDSEPLEYLNGESWASRANCSCLTCASMH